MNRTRNVLFSYLIFAIGGYGTHLFSPWVYDDVPLIEKNDFLQLKFLFHFFRSFISDSNYSSVGYRPLPFAMFTLEKALFGPHPYLFRFDNILLLITTSLLIYLIARNIFVRRDLFFSPQVAYFIGLLFLCHPIQTNLIMLVWKRTDLLMSIGFLSAIYLYDRALQSNFLSVSKIMLGHLFSLAAFLSKESALIFVPILALFHIFFWRRTTRRETIWLYLPPILFSTLLAWIIWIVMPPIVNSFYLEFDTLVPKSTLLPTTTYRLTQLLLFWKYLKLAILPIPLMVFHPISKVSTTHLLLSLLGFFIWGFAIFKSFRKKPVLSFSLLFTLLLFFPSSWTPLHLPFDEDRLSFPLFPLLAGGATILISVHSRHFLKWGKFFSTALLFLFVIGTYFRSQEWKNEVALWQSNVAENPSDPRPLTALSKAWEARGRPELASVAIERALQLDPSFGLGHYLLATYLFEQGKRREAEDHLRTSIKIDGNRMRSLRLMADFAPSNAEAFLALWKGLQKFPNDSTFLGKLHLLAERVGSSSKKL